MTTFLFCLHISAALLIGKTAYQRGRSFIVWTLLTLIPYGILVTWPLLYILPRLTPPPNVRNGAQPEPTVAGQKLLGQLLDPHKKSVPTPTSNKSFYVGVSVWVVCLLIIGFGIILK